MSQKKKIIGVALAVVVIALGYSVRLVAQDSSKSNRKDGVPSGNDGVAGIGTEKDGTANDGVASHDGKQKCSACAEWMNSYRVCQETFMHCSDKGGKHSDGQHLR